MKLEKISLTNFRNIASLQIIPSPKVNVIYGNNAQGKTNLVEAVWLFTGAKSFRGGRDKEMPGFGCEFCKTEVEFTCGGRLQSASIELFAGEAKAGEKKKIELNEIPLERASGLSGRFFAVVFSPAHLSMVREGPSFRRQFLDTAICQIVPKYESYLREFERILQQRNALLKDIFKFPQLEETLDVWDERLAAVSAAIVSCRGRYVKKLAPLTAAVYSGLSGGKEELMVIYKSSALEEEDPAGFPRAELKQKILTALTLGRRADKERGATQIGPHRDDVEFMVNSLPLRLYGSQGQQRSCVLALKMAECSMIEEAVGEAPVVLLDDVMSELDAGRRDYLLNHMGDRQVFVTCCDEQSFNSMFGGARFLIENGALVVV